jgi:hypothetical protein
VNFGIEHGRGANGQLVALQSDGTIYLAIDLQVFRTGEVAFNVKVGTQPGKAASRGANGSLG